MSLRYAAVYSDSASFGYDPYGQGVVTSVRDAAEKLRAALRTEMPHTAGLVFEWMEAISPTGRNDDRFTATEMFPMVLLPWWLTAILPGARKQPFYSDLVYAMLNGYYHVRLIDDVMDREAYASRNLLPALTFFQSEAHLTLFRYFNEGHPFWQSFRTYWYESADCAVADASLQVVDRQAFEETASRKTCASMIPLCAVCHENNRLDLLPEWTKLCNLFGRFHQMWDDIVDWPFDAREGRSTFFLSQAERERQPDETLLSWFFRRGFQWGVCELEKLLNEMRALSQRLECAELARYLEWRESSTKDWAEKISVGLDSLNGLRATFERGDAGES